MKLKQLQEAKYHGAPSPNEIYDKFQQTINTSLGDVQVLDVEIDRDRQSVYADVRAWVHSKKEAIQAIEKFMTQHNIPYDKIEELNNVHDGDWRAIIVFGRWDGYGDYVE